VDGAFRGKGSLKTSGRWHRKGTQVAYASEHLGTAVLGKPVWLGSYGVARASRHMLLPRHLDPEEHLETLDEPDLPKDWDAFPHLDATRPSASVGLKKSAPWFFPFQAPLSL